MIETIWEVLTTFSSEAQQQATSKCEELGFDQTRGVISLSESYINLNSATNILKDAIEKNKLIQLPISIQKILSVTLNEIQKYQASLASGVDEVVNLCGAVEKLNTQIWQYGLHNLSEEVLGYQTKLNQIKALEITLKDANKELRKGVKLNASIEQANTDASDYLVQINGLVLNAEESAAKALELQQQVTKTNTQAAAIVSLMGDDKSSSEQLLVSTKSSNEEASNLKLKIDSLLTSFTNLKSDLEAAQAKQESIFGEFAKYRETVNGLIGDASRTGMAASFKMRGDALNTPTRIWAGVFVISIIALAGLGLIYLRPIIRTGDLSQILSRLILTAPLIWLGWFSAKQYGYNTRLREDYAFKEAAAMSFEGYKREAKEVSPEMLNNLMEASIKNLSDNPIRIYSGSNNHASPMHEMLDKALKDGKFVDLLKDILEKYKA